jgi:hypothetical protein
MKNVILYIISTLLGAIGALFVSKWGGEYGLLDKSKVTIQHQRLNIGEVLMFSLFSYTPLYGNGNSIKSSRLLSRTHTVFCQAKFPGFTV